MWLLLLTLASAARAEPVLLKLQVSEDFREAALLSELRGFALGLGDELLRLQITLQEPSEVSRSSTQACLFRYLDSQKSLSLWFSYISLVSEECRLRPPKACTDRFAELVAIPETDCDSIRLTDSLKGTAFVDEEEVPLDALALKQAICNRSESSPQVCLRQEKTASFGWTDAIATVSFLAVIMWGSWLFCKAWAVRREDPAVVAAFSKYFTVQQASP